MYRNLWLNAPKETHEFADYSLDRYFTKPIPSYVPHETFRDYILARAEDSDIRRFIQFNTVVRHVEFDPQKESFLVQTENLTTGKSRRENFDYVIVAVGHFSVPNIPYFEGIETFPGQVIHSHDFRDARQFAGRDILIIGGSYSAEDIALQTFKFGAKSITISYRTKPMLFKWPRQIEEKPLLNKISGKTVHFSDGSVSDYDAIVICTGYKHHFPFLEEDIRLVATNCLYPTQLYKGIFFNDQPRLMYLGMQDLIFSLSLFDAQAWYVRDVILGRIEIPNKSEREIDMSAWKFREMLIKEKPESIDFQTAYVKDLVDATDYPFSDSSLEKTAAIFKAWLADKQSSIIKFRDQPYVSAMTGTKATTDSTPWLEAKEDSEFV